MATGNRPGPSAWWSSQFFDQGSDSQLVRRVSDAKEAGNGKGLHLVTPSQDCLSRCGFVQGFHFVAHTIVTAAE
jgi:hypothetical protein